MREGSSVAKYSDRGGGKRVEHEQANANATDAAHVLVGKRGRLGSFAGLVKGNDECQHGISVAVSKPGTLLKDAGVRLQVVISRPMRTKAKLIESRLIVSGKASLLASSLAIDCHCVDQHLHRLSHPLGL